MRRFRDLPTRTKLTVSFSLAALACVGVGLGALRELAAMEARAEAAAHDTRINDAIDKSMQGMQQAALAVRERLLADDRAATTTVDDGVALLAGLDRALASSTSPAERLQLTRMIDLRDQFETDSAATVALARTDRAAALAELGSHDTALLDEFDHVGAGLQDAFEARAAARAAQDAAAYREALLAGVTFILVAVGLSLVAGWRIARSLARPLARSVEVLDRVAAGDFTAHLELDRQDEVGQVATALDRATAQMCTALGAVRDVSQSVATAADELAGHAGTLAAGAQQQASSLEESAASIEQITATVKQSADNARVATQLAEGARTTAQRGGRTVTEAVAAMTAIDQASKRITEIIAVVDDIAFQTNLLALNAAVEAARAGEQGRGFAVVAAEVRSLAQRSATAAGEIRTLIGDSVGKVTVGTELVHRCGLTLDEIVASVTRVHGLVGEMAGAAREESSGIEQINVAVAQMDQVTQGNAASTEEMSATAQALTTQAERLRTTVAGFRIAA